MDPLVTQATQPVLARMEREARQVSPEVAELLQYLRLHLFEVGFRHDVVKLAFGNRGAALADAFAAETGHPLADYLAQTQLEIALRLLMESDLPAARIARFLLYSSPGAFRSQVTRVFGMPPGRLRRQLRISRALQQSRDFEPAKFFRPEGTQDMPPLTRSERSRILGRLAENVWNFLQQLPFAKQKKLLREEILVGGPELFELLSERSREAGPENPKRGVELAQLAMVAIEGSLPLLGAGAMALHALAQARLAQAWCRAGDIGEACDALLTGATELAETEREDFPEGEDLADPAGPSYREQAQEALEQARADLVAVSRARP